MWQYILDNGGSVASVYNKIAERHEQLLRLIDVEASQLSGYGNVKSDGLSNLTEENLTRLFTIKSRALVQKHFCLFLTICQEKHKVF